MATINDKKMIQNIISNNGHFEDDPQITSIVEYTNMAGLRTWGITYPHDDRARYLIETEFIKDPVLIWDNRIGQVHELVGN